MELLLVKAMQDCQQTGRTTAMQSTNGDLISAIKPIF
jgi:hypothetical protein